MAKTYSTHSYSGFQQLTPLVKPHIQDKALQDLGIFIDTTRDNAYEWTFVEVGDHYIYPFAKGFQGGNSGDLSSKRVALVEFKKETSYSAKKYINRIERYHLRNGGNNHDMTASRMAEIEMYLHAMGVRTGIYKSFWLGDTAKKHTKDGQYINGDAASAYKVDDPDKRYNATDGIWKEIETRLADDNIPRVKLTGTGVSTALLENNELQSDAAKEIMKQCYVNASDELKSLYNQGEAAFYVTNNILMNYQDTLESDNTSNAHEKVIHGVDRFTFRKLPIYDMLIDGDILRDFGGDKKFRVMLSVPENLGIVLGLGSTTETRFWFNPDENENRQRTQFEMEHCFLDPKYISVAY
jgi:hypothetical protein